MKKVAGTRHDKKLQGGGEARRKNNVHSTEGRDRRMQNNAKRNPLALQFLVYGLDEGKDQSGAGEDMGQGFGASFAEHAFFAVSDAVRKPSARSPSI